MSKLRRHGKFLVFDLDADLTWVIHLGMSGRIDLGDGPLARHTNFLATLDDGTELRFVDPRTFGFVAVYTPDELATSSLAKLGPDALDALPSATGLWSRLVGRRAAIKALLLDQRLLAGLGNIYADETLHRARLHPMRPGNDISPAEVALLRRAIRTTLREGIRHNGTSLGDLAYLLPDGRAGEQLDRLRVYGRAGARCRRCGGTITRTVIAQRSTHYCPGCQR